MSSAATTVDDLKPEYPAPPSVHWLVLFVAWFAVLLASYFFAPPDWRQTLPNLIFSLWIFYFCFWLLRLDRSSKGLYWAFASVAGELFLSFFHDNSTNTSWTGIAAIAIVVLVSFALPFITIFVIRAELLRHYNQREPVDLKLNPLLTLLLSYIYFQYHLFDIAQRKAQIARESVIHGSTRQLPSQHP